MNQNKQPLALKYRPRKFSEIVGNEFQVKIFKASIKEKEISNAYFLSGTRGCGKTSTARIFAKALNCLMLSDDGEPCLKCGPCISIQDESNIDVIELDGASENSLENIRHINEIVIYSTTQAKYKVIIIDEAHSLSSSAANALLKTLEEPPPNVVFIFCTTEPERVLDTVKSRCLIVRFKNISINEIVGRLRFICTQENIEAEDDALEFIARYARGGLRDAICLLDQLSRYKEKLSVTFLRKALTLIDNAEIFSLINSVFEDDEKAAVEKAIELTKDKPLLDFVAAILEILETIYLHKLDLVLSKAVESFAEKIERKKLIKMVLATKQIMQDAKYFYILSQKTLITFFISRLFEIMHQSKEDKPGNGGPVVVGDSKIQRVEEVFQEVDDISLKTDLLNKFGIQ